MSQLFVWAVGASAALCFCVCAVLVFHKKYKSGLCCTVALSVISLAAFSRALSIFYAGEYYGNAIGGTLWMGLAVFLGDHFYNFWRYRNVSRPMTHHRFTKGLS